MEDGESEVGSSIRFSRDAQDQEFEDVAGRKSEEENLESILSGMGVD